ncbi:MAG: hypothetical protein GY847_37585 [Proteobacteria bacterium]|nr:hypothetical protein [Pseudomonadota bacterium]
MSHIQEEDSFFCCLCGRDQPDRLLSSSELVDRAGRSEPLCKQCNGFLDVGLSHLVDRIAAQKKTVVARQNLSEQRVADSGKPHFRHRKSRKKPSLSVTTSAELKSPEPQVARARRASSIERELYTHRSLSLSRYIDGFVKGLEVGGLDRKYLEPEASNAINILLSICQKLASERLRISSNRLSRSEVRRLTRHVDETSLMVEEYVEAVCEACERRF